MTYWYVEIINCYDLISLAVLCHFRRVTLSNSIRDECVACHNGPRRDVIRSDW
eukprot:m.26713 g.26713  ORF g.26713 m.26713 type:complete len:53 (-) comp11701_c1_seq15:54-212(-)